MELVCSFCGTSGNKNLKIHQGATANICMNCLEVISELEIEKDLDVSCENEDILKPHEIKAELDKYVIGQEEAKRVLSVEAYNHFKRLNSKSRIPIEKTNIALVGPSGSGKTFIIETLAKTLDVPFIISDATNFTEAGYVGKDVESMIVSLLEKCEWDVDKVERGIIYIDEIDKIVSKSPDIGRSRDVGGEGVQQALLKMIEGSEVTVKIPNSLLGKKEVTVNTKNILFIVGGAFDGIDKIIKNRLKIKKDKKTIGFKAYPVEEKVEEKTEKPNKVTSEDIIEFGFIEEFVGRVPLVVTLNKLTEEDFVDILKKSKNSIIKQYQTLFKMDNVKLNFEKEALTYIAKEAMNHKVGARALKGILAKKMNELQYELPFMDIKEFVVTKEYLENK